MRRFDGELDRADKDSNLNLVILLFFGKDTLQHFPSLSSPTISSEFNFGHART